MKPRTRARLGLLLIVALFAAPLLTAYVLNANGWRPSGMRNYGTLIEPPRDLTAARFVYADDGKPLAWKDQNWSWTIFALPGAHCAHPHDDHLMPLYVALGAGNGDQARRLNDEVSYGALAMDAYSFG